MNQKKSLKFVVLGGCFFLIFIVNLRATSWEHHTLLTKSITEAIPELSSFEDVEVVSFETCLLAMESVLETVLDEQETWARTHLGWYAPRPEALAFRATGDSADIRLRFFEAIRINPNSKVALYLSRLVSDPEAPRGGLAPEEVTLLPNARELNQFEFLPLAPGDRVSPVEVLITASHEPDYGFDVGLFEDNGTEFGARYGFGTQAFGDPKLDYGSQAPFHMGFYHESWIIFLFASFLKQSYPEYRIHLFKTLSQTAFEQGQPYWGWRFMGWGLHYLMDLTMPYHTTVLPGYSTFKMLLINLLDILGCSKYKDDAVQLVSNRHAALERYQGILFERIIRTNAVQHALNLALNRTTSIPSYSDDLPRNEVARQSHALSKSINKKITAYMPDRFVNDASVELTSDPELDQIVELTAAESGSKGISELNDGLVEALTLTGTYSRSYILSLMPK